MFKHLKNLDKGKIIALRNANFTLKSISQKLKIPVSTI